MRTHHHRRSLRRLVVAALVPALAMLTATTATSAPAAPQAPQRPTAAAPRLDTAALPVTFARNDGQAPSGVRYLGGVPGVGVAFTDTGVTLNLTPTPSQHDTAGSAPATAVTLRFVDANPHPTITGAGRAAGVINDIHGPDPANWHTNIPTFARVVYHDVWPGTDATFTARHGTLKYFFTLAPGADANNIRLSYTGADHLTVDDGGDLAITAGKTVLHDQAPISYQHSGRDRQPVSTGYHLLGGTSFGFTLAQHTTGPLTIDPGLDYGTFINGTSGRSSAENGVGHDAEGNLYIFGGAGMDYPTTPGSYQPIWASGTDEVGDPTPDMIITKLDPTGSRLIYSTFVGDTGRDTVADGVVASDGSVYVVGVSDSSDFPTTAGAYHRTPFPLDPGIANVNLRAVALRLDPTGSRLLYGTYLAPDFAPLGMAVGQDGSITVTGRTSSDYLPTTPGAFQTAYQGGTSTGYVMRLNAAGSDLTFATYMGPPITDQSNPASEVDNVTVDSTGASYITGGGAPGFPTTTGPQPSHGSPGVLIKLDPSGHTLDYATYIGGGSTSASLGSGGVAVDNAGNAYVAAFASPGEIATTPDASQPQCAASRCAAVIKYGPTGNVVYASYFGGTSGITVPRNMAIDGAGRIYITGQTSRDSNLPVTPDAFSTTQGNFAAPFFVAVLDKGTLDYSTYLGGSGNVNIGGGISATVGSLDIAPNVTSNTLYLAGSTNAPDFPTTPDAFQPTYPGGFNSVWAGKLTLPTLPPPNMTSAGTTASPHPNGGHPLP